MASLVWLIVWLVQGTPDLEWFGSWNDWAVALLACALLATGAFDVRSAAADEPTFESANAAFADGHVEPIRGDTFPRRLMDGSPPETVRDENMSPNPTVYSDPDKYLLP